MIVLFTDFGAASPYVGLMKQAILVRAPALPIVDLLHEAPQFDAQAGAYLLAAYAGEFPRGCVFVGVVDPGVGSARKGLILQADGRWFVGPDNGLFNCIARRAKKHRAWHITWTPGRLSATFHGRDIFAPVAAMLAGGEKQPQELGQAAEFCFADWPDELARIVYIDHYGNAMTGIRASALRDAGLQVGGQALPRARTFAEVAPGQGFWYENSSGLAEIALNQGSAASFFDLSCGDPVTVTAITGGRCA